MKRTILSLALVLGAIATTQPLLAQNGTSNGSGSGFLNSDLMVGRGGTPGPAELNLRLDGAAFMSPYAIAPIGVSTVSGRVLTQPAVIAGGGTVIPQGDAVVTRSVVLPNGACAMPMQRVIEEPAVVAPACVNPCLNVCTPSDALIVPGETAPTLIDI